MARFVVTVTHPPKTPPDMDAVILGLRVTKDGDYFQAVSIAASKLQQATYPDVFGDPHFWATSAVRAVRLIAQMIDDGELPTATPQTPLVVAALHLDWTADPDLVDIPLEEGAVVGSFDR